MKTINTYKFEVRVRESGNESLVTVYITGRWRDDAALDVPSAVCGKLGRTISMYNMLIVNG